MFERVLVVLVLVSGVVFFYARAPSAFSRFFAGFKIEWNVYIISSTLVY